MRTSTIAASGLWARTLRSRSSASPACPTTSKPASSSRRTTPSRSSTESSATTSLIGETLAKRDAGAHDRAAGIAVGDRELAVQRRDPIGQSLETGTVRVGTAAAIVGDLDHEGAVAPGNPDPGMLRARVFGHVRQRLRDQEVGRRLDT